MVPVRLSIRTRRSSSSFQVTGYSFPFSPNTAATIFLSGSMHSGRVTSRRIGAFTDSLLRAPSSFSRNRCVPKLKQCSASTFTPPIFSGTTGFLSGSSALESVAFAAGTSSSVSAFDAVALRFSTKSASDGVASSSSDRIHSSSSAISASSSSIISASDGVAVGLSSSSASPITRTALEDPSASDGRILNTIP